MLASMHMRLMAFAFVLAPVVAQTAGTPLADIRRGPADSWPTTGITLPRGTVFRAFDTQVYHEPWITDGTIRGTGFLKDTVPGPVGVRGLWAFRHYQDRALFVVNNQLWITDGSIAGTQSLATIRPSHTNRFDIGGMAELHNRVWFMARDSGYRELWQTDGTSAGTRVAPSFLPRTEEIVRFRDQIALGTGNELWLSDGTAAGTRRVAQLSSGATIERLTAFGNDLLFRADASTPAAPWISDGTPGGTRPLVEDPAASRAAWFVDLGNGIALFKTSSGLWRTDGTRAGTRRLFIGSIEYTFTLLQLPQGPRLLFPAQGMLWATDGELAGTKPLLMIPPMGDFLASSATKAWFSLRIGPQQDELWVTDGSATGTRRVASSRTMHFAHLARNKIIFPGWSSSTGLEPWAVGAGATSLALGKGCAPGAQAPRLRLFDPVLGSHVAATGDFAPRGGSGVLLLGAGPSIPLGRCRLYPGQGPWLVAPIRTAGADWSSTLRIPNDLRLEGIPFIAQAVFLGSRPAGLSLSNGIAVFPGR